MVRVWDVGKREESVTGVAERHALDLHGEVDVIHGFVACALRGVASGGGSYVELAALLTEGAVSGILPPCLDAEVIAPFKQLDLFFSGFHGLAVFFIEAHENR